MSRFLGARYLAAGTALMAILMTLQVTIGAPAAEARCSNGVEQLSRLGNLRIFVEEVPLKDSCNNNTLYQGRFRAAQPDTIAEVWIQNNGRWDPLKTATYGQGWVQYEYNDANRNSFMALCWYSTYDYVANCGWGKNYYSDFYGVTGVTPNEDQAAFNTSPLHGVNSGF